MGFVRFLLLLVVVVAGAYVFWPRTPGFAECDPATAARHRTESLRAAASGRFLEAAAAEYLFLAHDLRYPPLSAAGMAWHRTRALEILRRARDRADEDEALAPLAASLAPRLASPETAEPLARLELVAIQLARAPARRRDLESAIADRLALMHGGTAGDWTDAAAAVALAETATHAGDWTAAESALGQAFARIREQTTPRVASPPPR